jgi:hypothetical protein
MIYVQLAMFVGITFLPPPFAPIVEEWIEQVLAKYEYGKYCTELKG